MVMNIDYTCRICLDDSAINNIFTCKKTYNSLKYSFHEVMVEIFSLTVDETDSLPKKICRSCTTKLSSAFKLKYLAQSSYEQLLKYFSTNVSQLKSNNEFKNEIKEEQINLHESILSEGIDIKTEDSNECSSDNNNVVLNEYSNDNCNQYDLESDKDDNTPLIFSVFNDNNISDGINKNFYDSMSIEKPLKKQKYGKTERHQKRKKLKGEKQKKTKSKTICHLCGKLVNNIHHHSLTHSQDFEKKKLPCGDCSKEFISMTARNRHRNVHHLGKRFFCDICQKEFKHQWQHVRLNHSSAPRPFKCLLCEKKFFTAGQLNYHIKFHTKEKSFQCETCGKGFRTSTDRNYHKRSVHEKERTIICQFCPKAFFSNPDLKKHMRTHLNERNHKCNQCDKAFNRLQALKQHLKIHTGIKTISCEICNKSFYTNGNLKIHMISHTKERIHPCKYCGVKFGRTHHRDRHQKTAHENKLET